MRPLQHPDYPLTVYYAFKKAESEAEEDEGGEASSNGNVVKAIASTGWETMLEGLIRAGFTITGTWPGCHSSRCWYSSELRRGGGPTVKTNSRPSGSRGCV